MILTALITAPYIPRRGTSTCPLRGRMPEGQEGGKKDCYYDYQLLTLQRHIVNFIIALQHLICYIFETFQKEADYVTSVQDRKRCIFYSKVFCSKGRH